MRGLPAAQRWCDALGAQGCMPKPFDVGVLLGQIETLLEKRG